VSIGQHPSDFVGYNVGKPPVIIQAGFVGLLDFAGYPVGQPPFVPPVPVVVSGYRPGLFPSQIDYGKIRRRREDEEIIILK
jgi:hypothetical protein